MKHPVLVLILVLIHGVANAQTEGARISGRVTDQRGTVIVGAECKVTNIETNVSTTTATNEDGIYVIPDLRPASYRLTIQKAGFRTVIRPSLQLYVQDAVNENFTLAIGLASESITVVGATSGLQTDSAAVSTVVDHQFVENTPLNGRSFQSLILLSPGVTAVPRAGNGEGEFSVNGQRTEANYYTVDGVSANVAGTTWHTGTNPVESTLGTTQSMVSVDALQEFRINTSTYSA